MLLTAAEITRVADEAFAASLTDAGFSQQKPRHWVRTTKSPIHELIHLFNGRIAYGVDWGVGATFVPRMESAGNFAWKRTEKSSQIDFPLGARGRKLKDDKSFWASTVESNGPVYEIVFGIFKRRVATPNQRKYVTDEPGIRAIVENACRAALEAFDRIQSPRDVADLAASSDEAPLTFPPTMMPNYWLTLGLYNFACGRENEATHLLDQASRAFDIDLNDPVLQESIVMARSHFRESVQ